MSPLMNATHGMDRYRARFGAHETLDSLPSPMGWAKGWLAVGPHSEPERPLAFGPLSAAPKARNSLAQGIALGYRPQQNRVA
jgi:hypothetical protein